MISGQHLSGSLRERDLNNLSRINFVTLKLIRTLLDSICWNWESKNFLFFAIVLTTISNSLEFSNLEISAPFGLRTIC